MESILVVDDDKLIRHIAGDILTGAGYQVFKAKSSPEGIETLKGNSVDAVLLDVVMPMESGFEMIPQINDINSDAAVIMMTAFVSVDSAIEAIRRGAYDYIRKPLQPDELLHSVRNALERQKLIIENRELVENLESMVRKRTTELEKANEELKSAQAQLLQTEKLSSLGQLAAGVAHEINNPIGFINSNLRTMGEYVEGLMGFVEKCEIAVEAIKQKDHALITARLNDMEETKKNVGLDFIKEDIGKLITESKDGAFRVYKIVRDLRDFSRADDAERKVFDVHRALDSTLNIVWNELKYKAEVVKDYGEIPDVECLPAQLNQVFMNLFVNAAQAIDAKGTITIKTYCEKASVFVEVSDTGSGIEEDKINKIFDPFFTTKEPGKGTGLGLSIAYNIIKKHKGEIHVVSRVGEGTTFTVELPVEMGLSEGAHE